MKIYLRYGFKNIHDWNKEDPKLDEVIFWIRTISTNKLAKFHNLFKKILHKQAQITYTKTYQTPSYSAMQIPFSTGENIC